LVYWKIKITPINLILTESDAPVYKKSPLGIPLIVEKIASIKGISNNVVMDEIGKNTESFLKSNDFSR